MYKDAPSQCIKQLLQSIKEESGTDADIQLHSIRMSTTVATNALLESKEINLRSQSPKVSLTCQKLETKRDRTFLTCLQNFPAEFQPLTTVSGQQVVVLKRLDVDIVRQQLMGLKQQGIDNIAISLMHSYVYPDHEQQIASIARELGFKYITVGSETSPMIKYLHRTISSCVNAYLTPVLQQYLDSFEYQNQCPIYFMQSNGSLTPVDQFYGFKDQWLFCRQRSEKVVIMQQKGLHCLIDDTSSIVEQVRAAGLQVLHFGQVDTGNWIKVLLKLNQLYGQPQSTDASLSKSMVNLSVSSSDKEEQAQPSILQSERNQCNNEQI
ncbi:hypothetical protein MIR68_005754 [Amoeboaphelidium protococcarum]|nr:hypothetical protein MIR68_005754 [Amoeboaphelidium protococcarum]KAI3645928.1 hypothetical protein MP228_008856 [Amoeboaphelidium protococcarum]